MSTTSEEDRLGGIVRRLDRALVELEEARPLVKELRRSPVIELSLRLIKRGAGIEQLYALAPRFEPAGVFHASDWSRPADLEARLVSGSLRGPVASVATETMSLLRMLAIAEGRIDHADVEPAGARRFIEEVIAMNLDLLFPESSDGVPAATDHQPEEVRDGVRALLELLIERAGADEVLRRLTSEAERVLAQQPILVARVVSMIRAGERLVPLATDADLIERAEDLRHAIDGPTPLSRDSADADAYAAALSRLDADAVLAEADAMAASMRRTGLVAAQHVSLLQHLLGEETGSIDGIARALGLDEVGVLSLRRYEELTRAMLSLSVRPATPRAALGVARVLERGALFFEPVATALWRLVNIDLHPEAAAALKLGLQEGDDPHEALLSGALQILGQPLGVGQGNNPSCQSTRAISLWAQNDPGYLLELIASAARDDAVEMPFEGQPILSKGLPPGLVEELHTELDHVSLLLVPHLDRIYVEMGRRTYDRGEDGHRWVNPELHGWWARRGFATTIEYATGAVKDHAAFVRLFHATYHPDYNGGRGVIYPQPAGIAGTDSHGRLLDWHAISIQRVALDPNGEMRAYFYNPNADGGQRWGDATTSTEGHGERPGEASLPFDRFAAHVYLFHYDPREQGDPSEVPADVVERAADVARRTWAQQLTWLD